MLELTAAQSLITRISAIGIASAVFTYYLVKLLVKPYIDVKLANNPYREFATNAASAASTLSTAEISHALPRTNIPVIT